MERFVVSARKYRPQTFDTVVGQQHITGTLKNAIKNNHLAQAFLFCGPRGVGKTTCARILAKTINCFNITAQTEACDQCDSCVSFNSGQSLNVFELDAASNNSVDDIRNLIDQVRFAPQLGLFRVYIIDEVHMLSQAAFNAFLKTLEEPPKHAIFILATTEKHKIIPTILSRCQVFDFNRIRIEDMAGHLAWIAKTEGVEAEPEALRIIAQKADGGLRDACSMFDQMVSFSGGSLSYKTVIENLHVLDYDYYFKTTDALLKQDISSSLLIFDEILKNGFDGHHFIAGLGEHLRNVLVCKDPVTVQLLEVSENIRQKYLQQAEACSASFLLKALGIANRCDAGYKIAKNQRLQVELALLQMCHLNAPLVQEAEKKNDGPELKTAEEKQVLKKEVLKNSTDSTITHKITDKPLTSFTGLNVSSGFRLNAVREIVQQDAVLTEKIVVTKVPFNEAVTMDLLLVSTGNYVKLMQEKGKKQVATILRSESLKLRNDTEVVIELENSTQRESFEPVRQDFVDYLRKTLNNSGISLVLEEKQGGQTKKAYTPIEKFEVMLQKNPLLLDLKNRLDMEVDY